MRANTNTPALHLTALRQAATRAGLPGDVATGLVVAAATGWWGNVRRVLLRHYAAAPLALPLPVVEAELRAAAYPA